jgi:hypothetical protein
MFIFGSGALIGTPQGANPTPINFGLVQEVTIDESATLKSLFGQNRRALAVGAGTIKTTGKAKTAKISGLAMGSLYYGVAPVVGQVGTSFGEAGTIPAVSTYTITVANSANWTVDQGVIYAATGLPLKRVASAPAIGQYSVAAGVYTFAAADASKAVLLSYNYTISASGTSILINNPLLGATVSFGALLFGLDPTTSLGYSLQLYNCVSSKFAFGTKLEDFVQPEFDFECFVNPAGNLGQWNFPDSA